MNILLVDDSKLVRYKLREMISKFARENHWERYRIIEAEDGIEALDIVHNETIDIMFLDWNMPNLNGDHVVETVRADNKYKKLRIIMTTTEGSKESVMKMIKKGVNGYVLKPFKENKIFRALDALTGKRGK